MCRADHVTSRLFQRSLIAVRSFWNRHVDIPYDKTRHIFIYTNTIMINYRGLVMHIFCVNDLRHYFFRLWLVKVFAEMHSANQSWLKTYWIWALRNNVLVKFQTKQKTLSRNTFKRQGLQKTDVILFKLQHFNMQMIERDVLSIAKTLWSDVNENICYISFLIFPFIIVFA